jgi:hypothetical protein
LFTCGLHRNLRRWARDMVKPVRPSDAPGYKCKVNRDGTWREGWEARRDIVKRGYRPSWVRLFYPDTPDGRRQLAARCKGLPGQMFAWAAHEGTFPKRGYDSTVRGLAYLFQSDEDSPYHRMKWNSQTNFDKTIKIILTTIGERQIGKFLVRLSSLASELGCPGSTGKASTTLASEALHRCGSADGRLWRHPWPR